MNTLQRIAAYSLGTSLAVLLLLGQSACAASPSNYARKWNIKLDGAQPAQRIALPDDVLDVVKDTRVDLTVFDALDQPMRIRIYEDSVPHVGVNHTMLDCSPQFTDPSTAAEFRCETQHEIRAATGVRAQIFSSGDAPIATAPNLMNRNSRETAQIDLQVRDGTGSVLSRTSVAIENQSFRFRAADATAAFDGLKDISILQLSFNAPVQISQLRVAWMPQARDHLHWKRLSLPQTDADNRFAYALNSPVNVYAARLTFDAPPSKSLDLRIWDCHKSPCAFDDHGAQADTLRLGSGKVSFPVALHIDSGPSTLFVESNIKLPSAPTVEVGWPTEILQFEATGTPPYTLAAGHNISDDGNYNSNPVAPDSANAHLARLTAYSAAPRWRSRLADLLAPSLLIVMLSVGFGWALGSRRR